MRAPIELPSHVNTHKYYDGVSTHFGAIVPFPLLIVVGVVETGTP